MDSERFSIVRGPVDPRRFESVAGAGEGALVTFSGIVRGTAHDGRAVVGLSYEAYETMARIEFEAIDAQARERFGDVRLWIAHAVGDLAVGDVAVVVTAAARHRAAAFEACRFAIDRLKARAPIWKKERYADGAAQWRANETDE
ncbi:MAG TPA: molybdenum cofactor biosynthesis protein MoaE [Candidatus Cybelea sp.]|nr:molybdenum cofactor biosynthesis protein MoaE [Candidatus Cybelea sp.]